MKTTTSNRLKEIMSEQNLRQVDILEMVAPYSKKMDEATMSWSNK